MESARTLARAGAAFVCLDLTAAEDPTLDAELPYLLHRTEEAACGLLFVHEPAEDLGSRALRHYASLIIALHRHDWVFRSDGDLAGVQLEAVSVKNRLAPPGRQSRWVLSYPVHDPLP